MQAELGHGAAQFVGGLLRRLHRQRGDAGEAIRMFLAPACAISSFWIVDRVDADGGLLAVEPGLRRGREHMHVDLGRVHVGEPALDVMAAARKRPVGHAGDFEHGVVGVDRRELQPKARDFLLQELDGVVGEHVGMGIDGARHCLFLGLPRGSFAHKRQSGSKVRRFSADPFGDGRNSAI